MSRTEELILQSQAGDRVASEVLVTENSGLIWSVARRFMGRLAVYRSEPYFIEVMARGVNKADAIAGLLERLDMEREDVIACGDGLNDLTMIRYAGVGVAMGNAQKAVKEEADVITLSNDEDGIVPIIEKYILGS